MRRAVLSAVITVAASVSFTGSSRADKATHYPIECGPASWPERTCLVCKQNGKLYTVSKYVEGVISIAHETVKETEDPGKVVDAIKAALAEAPVGQKRWTESGEENPETTDTYCWKPVKAEQIKPLKDKGYLLGERREDNCVTFGNTCYHLTMECRKERDAKVFECNPKLQEFEVKDGKCNESPTATACDCKPDKYWKCGAAAMKGGKAPAKPAKKGKR